MNTVWILSYSNQDYDGAEGVVMLFSTRAQAEKYRDEYLTGYLTIEEYTIDSENYHTVWIHN